jgi:cobalt/nickel transport system ATP-binding protein
MLDSIMRISHHLSFGEKKRVSIATVLSMKPEILLLDEPSANLDPAARRHLIDLLKRLPVTKIIAGHDLELILELCSRVVVLDKGRIVADGKTEEILSNSSLMQSHSLEVPLSLRNQ